MKRTKNNKEELNPSKHVNLIRKITWSFHNSSGIEWDELFSEACVAYYEALNSYDPMNSTKESSWVYTCIQNQLKSFIKAEIRSKNLIGIEEWAAQRMDVPDYEYYFEEAFKEVSKDVRIVINTVLKNPNRYVRIGLGTKEGIGNLRKDLRNVGHWDFFRINKVMKDLRVELLK